MAMKRKYGGGYKRSAKRTRYSRRKSYKKSYRKSRGTYNTAERGLAVSSLYRARRLPYRAYKNKVYESLMFKESYRSYDTSTANVTTVVSADTKLWTQFRVPADFYLSAGGYDGSSTFSTDKLIIKGGMLNVTLRNDMADPIIVEFGKVKFKNSEGLSDIVGTTLASFDISNWPNFGTGFKLTQGMRKMVVAANDTITMTMKIPMIIINDLNQWTTEALNIETLVYSVFSQTAGALALVRTVQHNLTFVADAI